MKIAVIDDEKPQADILYSICNAYFGGHKQNVQIDCFPNGIAFFNSFKENTYKIAFVDIFMEKMNGIAVAEKLREKNRNILIVFVTTSPDFMMQAFSVHAFHYITKPYKAEQIYKVLDDASSYVSDNSKYIEVMCDRRNTLISLKEIVSVESDAHYINIGVVSGLRYRTRMTITEFLKLADNDTRFIPVNRGIVLNADYIKALKALYVLQATVKDSRLKFVKKLGLNRVSVNICSKKSEKTSGGEHGRIHKISSGIFQLCHNNTVKFILPFTVKKSIKIPDFKDSNALFVFIYHTRFSLVNCDDGF